ncbi:calcium-binding protein [Nocardioides sp. LML1-1-1.1]|uniref:calcium-binding protein n=1 Tax=Nocardioides sp. LML1-1-1.1 TaxID=3135248 RepID=UPI0034295664
MNRRRTVMARASVALAATAALLLVPGTVPSTHAAATVASAAAKAPRCTIVGTPRSDRLVGTKGSDVICGRGGTDVIVGGGGNDIIYGGPGNDRIYGGAGNDRLYGQGGGDTVEGEAGADVLLGGPGNDDLTGGAQTDQVDGGGGTNWCTLGGGDRGARCVYDRRPGAADRLSVAARSVDVTLADRRVTVQVHITDDTGVTDVLVNPSSDTPWFAGTNLRLVSGDVRNGWWAGTLTLHRWSQPGTFVPTVRIADRVGRESRTPFPGAGIAVLDRTPDLEQPEVTLLSPEPTTTYDVRTGSAKVTVRARITDLLSGVDTVSMSIWAPRHNGMVTSGYGDGIRLTSGNRNDGTWTGTVFIPPGEVGGDWSVNIAVDDRARRGARSWAYYWGPGEYVGRIDSAVDHPFPSGMGSFRVIGRARTDSSAPTIGDVSLTPSSVDTLPGPAQVQLSLRAADVGLGVDGIRAELVPAQEDDNSPAAVGINPDLSSGTVNDGTWTGTLTLPQGLPPGAYYLRVYVWDREQNAAMYLSSGHPEAASWTNVLPGSPMVTVVDTTP